MRKTETHDLNLIDMDDTFSPDPINENTEKLEAALADMEDSLDQRLKALEAHRLYAGSYKGDGGTQTIHLSFTPAMVLICAKTATASVITALALPNSPVRNNSKDIATIIFKGFTVYAEFNATGTVFHYFALA